MGPLAWPHREGVEKLVFHHGQHSVGFKKAVLRLHLDRLEALVFDVHVAFLHVGVVFLDLEVELLPRLTNPTNIAKRRVLELIGNWVGVNGINAANDPPHDRQGILCKLLLCNL